LAVALSDVALEMREGAQQIGIRILISRVGNGVGNAVENHHIHFTFSARESLGGNQYHTSSHLPKRPQSI
jgi:hypothetical protein